MGSGKKKNTLFQVEMLEKSTNFRLFCKEQESKVNLDIWNMANLGPFYVEVHDR